MSYNFLGLFKAYHSRTNIHSIITPHSRQHHLTYRINSTCRIPSTSLDHPITITVPGMWVRIVAAHTAQCRLNELYDVDATGL